MKRLLPLACLLMLGACATGPSPTQVTRFNLGVPIERGSVFVRPVEGQDADSLEFQTYAGAVMRQLSRLGYVAGQPASSLYMATVDIQTGTRAALAQRSPVSIGVGGGTGGFGSGIGLGAAFGLGGGGSRDVQVTELRVQMMRRSDSTVVWEGRAQGEARAGSEGADPARTAERLAEALFRDFPGRNGETVLVR